MENGEYKIWREVSYVGLSDGLSGIIVRYRVYPTSVTSGQWTITDIWRQMTHRGLHDSSQDKLGERRDRCGVGASKHPSQGTLRSNKVLIVLDLTAGSDLITRTNRRVWGLRAEPPLARNTPLMPGLGTRCIPHIVRSNALRVGRDNIHFGPAANSLHRLSLQIILIRASCVCQSGQSQAYWGVSREFPWYVACDEHGKCWLVSIS